MSNNAPFKVKKGIAAPYFPSSTAVLLGTSIDVSFAQYFIKTLDANTTFTFTNPPTTGEVASFIVEVNGPPAINYDIANAVYDNVTFDITSYDMAPLGLFFKPDGSEMYIAGNIYDEIYQFSLSTAYDISTSSVSYTTSTDTSTYAGIPAKVLFDDTGTKMYVLSNTNDTIYQFSLSTAWDVSTRSSSFNSESVAQQVSDPTGMTFNNDGTKLYVIDRYTDKLYQYSLSTAYDITTLSYDNILLSINTAISGTTENVPWGVTFNGDGSKVYIVGQTNDVVYEYSCSSPYYIGGASYQGVYFDVSGQEISPTDIKFNSDGSKMYILGYDTDSVYQYTVQTIPSSTYTITWPTNIKWDGGSAPAGPDVMEKDRFLFFTFDGGTTYYGKKIGDNV
jgi:6-phosphogluconolactonase (cycloisomerase 2 family)